MNKILKRILISLVLLVALAIPIVSRANMASADADFDTVYKELMLNIMKKCYLGPLGPMNRTVDSNEYRSNAYNDTTAFQNLIVNGPNADSEFFVPTGIGSGNNLSPTSGGTKATCSQLFLGGNGLDSGIFDLFGKSIPDHQSPNLANELKNIGYTDIKAEAKTYECLVPYYSSGEGSSVPAGKICWERLPEGDSTFPTPDDAVITPGDGEAAGMYLYLQPYETGGGTSGKPRTIAGHVLSFYNGEESCEFRPDGWSDTYIEGRDYIDEYDGVICDNSNFWGARATWKVTLKKYEGIDTNEFTATMGDVNTSYKTARQYFSGENELHDFNNEEIYVFLYEYLDKIYKIDNGDGKCKKRSEVEAEGGPIQENDVGDKIYYIYKDGGYYNIVVRGDRDADVSVFGTKSHQFLEAYCGDVECVIKGIWNVTNSEPGVCEGEDGGGGGKPDKEDWRKGELVDCNKFENIGAMEWVLCPVMNNGQYTATWIDNLTQEWLEVKPDLYSSTAEDGKGTSKVYEVWDRIRNIANILMVIFFLVIIFSQVTGYGIDNYGIKKMLPRLIVMAIVINLSLYICQIAVDLSNITGVGLRNMFSSIGMSVGSEKAEAGSFISDMIFGLFATASVGGPTALAGATLVFSLGLGTVVAVVILVIVLVMVVLVAVIVLFLMLGAREIMVVACIVLSPLAFAAFILPNTHYCPALQYCWYASSPR